MKKLHVFNPEHDLALAFGKSNFTPPTAGRGMRLFLGALSALWADDGDLILLDSIDEALVMQSEHGKFMSDVRMIAKRQLENLTEREWEEVSEISPWGWNAALRRQLERANVPGRLLPETGRIDEIRRLSHRESSIPILDDLVATIPQTIGRRWVAHNLEEAKMMLADCSLGVVKAPWSSSGRGVRFSPDVMSANMEGFVRNVLSSQGSVIVEPAYHKIVDFAMEFVSDGQGHASYSGLSLFETDNGYYLGNVLADEEQKSRSLSKLVSIDVVHQVSARLSLILGEWCKGVYSGPMGVDMMVVESGGCNMVHPCVEINLRRTMGHVALDLARRTAGEHSLMRIVYENGRYALRLS